MKAVVNNRIFLEATPELKRNLDTLLTYKIPGRLPMDPPFIIKNMKVVRSKLVSIPIGAFSLIPKEYEVIDNRVKHPVNFPTPLVTLRDDQKDVYNLVEDNCIINAKPGWGKTFTGLFIAAKLGQKTLIVVHTTNLRNQWAKEVEKVFGFKAGIIGGGKFDTDSPIVIGNTQSLYNKIPFISKEFGTLILDEMHHIPAASFSKLLDQNHARYKIGLSGTVKRKDGRHVYFKDYFSEEIHKPINDNVLTPEVHIHHPGFQFPDGGMPWANRVNDLEYNEEYQQYVASLATIYANKGHKVLVVAARTQFLVNVAKLIGDNAICITGETVKVEDREGLEQRLYGNRINVLAGAISIYKEGISINPLSCLIQGTPINNDPMLEQLAGRINRPHKEKNKTIIVDINLKGKTASNQARNRFAFYSKQGWKITTYQ
jgi:superfamily II DNA or RNA helicase